MKTRTRGSIWRVDDDYYILAFPDASLASLINLRTGTSKSGVGEVEMDDGEVTEETWPIVRGLDNLEFVQPSIAHNAKGKKYE